MKTMLALKGETNLSVLKDPFAAKNVTAVNLFYRCGVFNRQWLWRGTVTFANGRTSGEQDFEHENFDVIVGQINDFIASLGEQQ